MKQNSSFQKRVDIREKQRKEEKRNRRRNGEKQNLDEGKKEISRKGNYYNLDIF